MLATFVTGDTGARSSAMTRLCAAMPGPTSPRSRPARWTPYARKHAPALPQQPAVRTGREEDFQLAGTGRHATIFP
jgi:hypothetical protein